MARKSSSATSNKSNLIGKMGFAKKSLSSCELNERIQKKAFELFTKRGYSHGSDQKDWFDAEKIVISELKRS